MSNITSDKSTNQVVETILADKKLLNYIMSLVAKRLPREARSDMQWCKTVVDLSIDQALKDINLIDLVKHLKKSTPLNNTSVSIEEPANDGILKPNFSSSEPKAVTMTSPRRLAKILKNQTNPYNINKASTLREANFTDGTHSASRKPIKTSVQPRGRLFRQTSSGSDSNNRSVDSTASTVALGIPTSTLDKKVHDLSYNDFPSSSSVSSAYDENNMFVLAENSDVHECGNVINKSNAAQSVSDSEVLNNSCSSNEEQSNCEDKTMEMDEFESFNDTVRDTDVLKTALLKVKEGKIVADVVEESNVVETAKFNTLSVEVDNKQCTRSNDQQFDIPSCEYKDGAVTIGTDVEKPLLRPLKPLSASNEDLMAQWEQQVLQDMQNDDFLADHSSNCSTDKSLDPGHKHGDSNDDSDEDVEVSGEHEKNFYEHKREHFEDGIGKKSCNADTTEVGENLKDAIDLDEVKHSRGGAIDNDHNNNREDNNSADPLLTIASNPDVACGTHNEKSVMLSVDQPLSVVSNVSETLADKEQGVTVNFSGGFSDEEDRQEKIPTSTLSSVEATNNPVGTPTSPHPLYFDQNRFDSEVDRMMMGKPAKAPCSVAFTNDVVSEVRYRDRVGSGDKDDLFYNHEEEYQFTLQQSLETQRAEALGLTWMEYMEQRSDEDVLRDEADMEAGLFEEEDDDDEFRYTGELYDDDDDFENDDDDADNVLDNNDEPTEHQLAQMRENDSKYAVDVDFENW